METASWKLHIIRSLFTDFMLIGVIHTISLEIPKKEMSLLKSSPCILFLYVSTSHIYIRGTRKKEKTFIFSALHLRVQALITKPAPRVKNMLNKCSISFHKTVIKSLYWGQILSNIETVLSI